MMLELVLVTWAIISTGLLYLGLLVLNRYRPMVHLSRWVLIKFPIRAQQRLKNWVRYQYPDKTVDEFLSQRIWLLVTVAISFLQPIAEVTSAVCGMGLVFLIQQRKQTRLYRERVVRNWPEALDLLVMLLASGASIRAALHLLAQQPSYIPALVELARMQRALNTGVELGEALAQLQKRVPQKPIEQFCIAVLQSTRTGSSLTHVLSEQAQQQRQDHVLAAEKRAQQMSVKLMLPLVTCFFPVTFLLLLGPIFIRFSQGGYT